MRNKKINFSYALLFVGLKRAHHTFDYPQHSACSRTCLKRIYTVFKRSQLIKQDPYCLQELIYIWFHTVFPSIIRLSTERYMLIFFFRTSKIFYEQVHFGFLLAPGQVENFTISTPLFQRPRCLKFLIEVHNGNQPCLWQPPMLIQV